MFGLDAQLLILYTTVLLGQFRMTNAMCLDREIRLVPDGDNSPFVEYCYNGEWQQLCVNPSQWLESEAQVACRQLGYSNEGATPNFGDCVSSDTTNKTFSEVVTRCNGTENTLHDCGNITERNGCTCMVFFGMLVGRIRGRLQCQSACRDGEIRLVGGSTNNEGRVEVCVDGRWGTVCNKSQEGVAEAVCSQLGFPTEGATSVSGTFDPGFTPISSCTVQDKPTLNCSQITDGSCDHSMDLGVVCHTYEQLYNELREQTPIRECVTITAALGAVTGVLLVLLLVTVTALVVTCIVRKKRRETKSSTDKVNGQTNHGM